MISFNINNKVYIKTDDYDLTSSAWVNSLSDETKTLILDFTIMWNMFEHQVFNNSFKNNYKNNIECDKCCEKILSNQNNIKKIEYVYELFKLYNEKYKDLESQYISYEYQKSKIEFNEFKRLVNSTEYKDILKYLIYSCFRVRCNLFLGPKLVCDLDEQKLLFYSLNELMVLVAREYGY